MKKQIWAFLFFLFFCSIAYAAKPAYVLTIDTAISPAAEDYIVRGIDTANQQKASLVVITLDTPGGLEKSTRKIVQAILASPVPIATYVAPSGAHAASAGTYILYASHIAAMAPGTQIGAATPVNIGDTKDNKLSTMETKSINDAAAYIRSLAELRQRNADWAELAVRKAATLTADEALKNKVINLIAQNTPDLVKQVDGFVVEINKVPTILDTKQAEIRYIEPDWRYRVLSVLGDPNIAYILLLIGIYGIFFEFLNPGMVLPGLVGGICLLLAFYAFQLLPISVVGLTLLLVGIACMIGELTLPSFGLVGISGVAAFVIGSILLLDTNAPGFQIAWSLIFAMSVISAILFFIILAFAVKAAKRPIVAGREALLGQTGEVIELQQDNTVMVRIQGELWSAKSNKPLKIGQKIRVTQLTKLMLTVEPIYNMEE